MDPKLKKADPGDQLSAQEKWYLMALVANLYYNKNLTQDEIANRIYSSRSKVSRLLKEAKDSGVVEIRINEIWERSLDAERLVKELFNISYIRVIQSKTLNADENLERLGEVTAYYLDSLIDNGMVVGVSFGNTLYKVIKHIEKKNKKNIAITVVPIMGAMRLALPECDSIDLTKKLALSYGGQYQYLYAPAFVDNPSLKEQLLQDQNIHDVMQKAESADVILTSVGIVPDCTWKAVFSSKIWNALVQQGAVGSIAGHIYDIDGREVSSELSSRTVSLELKQLKSLKQVICVAAGAKKAKAVLGGLRGGYINSLIIDQSCAKELVNLLKR